MGERVPPWRLVGRDRELDEIKQALKDGRGVLLAGPAGVGKTRLLNAVADALRQDGVEVLEVSGVESVGASPWSAILDSAIGPSTDLASAVVDRLTRPRTSERLAVIVDDAQLLDGPSAAALHRVTRTGAAEVLVALRTGEPVNPAVTSLWKDDLIARFDLDALNRHSFDQLLDSVLMTEAPTRIRQWFWDRTQGHPMFLRELLVGLTDSGQLELSDTGVELDMEARPPERLIELVNAHLGRRTPEAIELLATIALGQPLRQHILDRLEAGGLNELRRHDLVNVDEGEVTVTHPLYGEASQGVVSNLDHLRVQLAKAMTDEPGQTRKAALLLLDAGQPIPRKLAAESIAEAVELFQPEIALRIGRYLPSDEHDATTARNLAVAAAMGGDPDTGDQWFERAVQAAAPEERSSLWLSWVSTAFNYRRDPAQVQSVAVRAMKEVSGGDKQVLQAWLLQPRMFIEPTEPVYRQLKALTELEHLDQRAAATVYLGVATCGWHLLQLDDAFDAVNRALEVTGNNLREHIRAQTTHVALTGWRHGMKPAMDLADAYLAAHGRAAGPDAVELLTVARLAVIALAGDAPGMAKLFASMTTGSRATHIRHQGIIGEYALALSSIPGREHEAEYALKEFNQLPDGMRSVFEPAARLAASRLSRSAGDVGGAQGHLGRALDYAQWRNARVYEVLCIREKAYTDGLDNGDPDLVEAATVGAGAGLAQLFKEEIDALWRSNPDKLDDVAQRIVDHGAPALAVEALRCAQQLHCDRGDLASALRSEVRADQLLAQHFDDWTPYLAWPTEPVLSEREAEVVQLVVDGHTNAEVGRRLYISPHTVKGHLERIYRRLGVRSRSDLAAIYAPSLERG